MHYHHDNYPIKSMMAASILHIHLYRVSVDPGGGGGGGTRGVRHTGVCRSNRSLF